MTWSDEFEGPDGSGPDRTKWVYDLGGDGWLNHELETYTERRANVRVERGNLVIEARREDYTGGDGIARHYTSGRLKTLGLFAQQEGRFEARTRFRKGGECGRRSGWRGRTLRNQAGQGVGRSM